MAQKVTGYIKLQIEAGKATPAPPVGPALGQKGVNIMAFTKEFNERTKNQMGYVLSLIHISEPTRRTPISYAVFCLKKKKGYTLSLITSVDLTR